MTPEELDAWRQRIAEKAATHRANVEGRDHDQPGRLVFQDTGDTYRTKRPGQRGRF